MGADDTNNDFTAFNKNSTYQQLQDVLEQIIKILYQKTLKCITTLGSITAAKLLTDVTVCFIDQVKQEYKEHIYDESVEPSEKLYSRVLCREAILKLVTVYDMTPVIEPLVSNDFGTKKSDVTRIHRNLINDSFDWTDYRHLSVLDVTVMLNRYLEFIILKLLERPPTNKYYLLSNIRRDEKLFVVFGKFIDKYCTARVTHFESAILTVNDSTPWSVLPLDVHYCILCSFDNVRQLVSMRLVCKAWNNMIASNSNTTMWMHLSYNTVIRSSLFPLCYKSNQFLVKHFEQKLNSEMDPMFNWRKCYYDRVYRLFVQLAELCSAHPHMTNSSFNSAGLFLDMRKVEPNHNDDDLEIGTTRYGGYPDMPPNIKYNNTMGVFVAQLNCSDFHSVIVDGGFMPSTGLILIFKGNIQIDDYMNFGASQSIYYDGDMSLLRRDKSVPTETTIPHKLISMKESLAPPLSAVSPSPQADIEVKKKLWRTCGQPKNSHAMFCWHLNEHSNYGSKFTFFQNTYYQLDQTAILMEVKQFPQKLTAGIVNNSSYHLEERYYSVYE
jgi:hypothetical protein